MSRARGPFSGAASVRHGAAGLALLVLIGLSPAVPGCRKEARKPHVILITSDTLRADHLGCYGYARNTSPRIDALARTSTLFLDCTSAANSTNPSFSSMHSGTFVKTHGVVALSTFGYRLADSLETLAELLADEGYVTVAAVSAHHLAGELSGLGQGFHHYFDVEDPAINKQPAPVTNGKVLPLLRTLYSGKDRTDRPLFLWMHYFDPHSPYDPPQEGLDQVLEGEETPRGDLEELIARYDGEIAFMDRAIGELIDALDEAGIYDQALVMFTADHGENLGEHGEVATHAHLYEQVVRVPLLIRLPGQKEGRTVSAPVQTVDLHPTVAAFLGRAEEIRDQVEGRDIGPLLSGPIAPGDRLVYSEGSSFKERMVRSGSHKLTYDVRRDAYELFDLQRDKGELTDLSRQSPAIRDELAEALNSFVGPALIDLRVVGDSTGNLLVRIRGTSDLWVGESALGENDVVGKVGHRTIEARLRLDGGSGRAFCFGHRGGPVDLDVLLEGSPVEADRILAQGVPLSTSSRVLLRLDLADLVPGGQPPPRTDGSGLSATVVLEDQGEDGGRSLVIEVVGGGGVIEGRIMADRSWAAAPAAGPGVRVVPLSDNRLRFSGEGENPLRVRVALPEAARILLLEARERLEPEGERTLARSQVRAAFRNKLGHPTFLLPSEAFTAPSERRGAHQEASSEVPLLDLELRRSRFAAPWSPVEAGELDEATRQRMILLGYLEDDRASPGSGGKGPGSGKDPGEDPGKGR